MNSLPKITPAVNRLIKKLAPKSKRGLTANQQQFKREVKRINRAIRSLEKRGYHVNRTDIDRMLQMPSRVTKSTLEKLSLIKTRNLYKYSTYQTEAGMISGYERLRQERAESARQAKITRERNKIEQITQDIFMQRKQREAPTSTLNEYISLNQRGFERFRELVQKYFSMWLERGAVGSFSRYLEQSPTFKNEQHYVHTVIPEPEPQALSPEGVPLDELPRETDNVLSGFWDVVDAFLRGVHEPARTDFRNAVAAQLNAKIAETSADAVAAGMQRALKAGVEFEYEDVYHEGSFNDKMSQFFSYIEFDDSIVDRFNSIVETDYSSY